MKFKMSYIGLLALIFGVIAVAAVFLDWLTLSMGIESSATGWDIFDDVNSYPVIVLILGIVAILFGLLEMLDMGSGSNWDMILNVILLVVGVLVIAMAYLAYADATDGIMSDLFEMAYGLYLEFVAGAGLIISGILGFTGVLKN